MIEERKELMNKIKDKSTHSIMDALEKLSQNEVVRWYVLSVIEFWDEDQLKEMLEIIEGQ